MTHAPNQILLGEIERFLTSSRMGPDYFGKVAVGNSELVKRLRAGRTVQLDTADKVRAFIRSRCPDGPTPGDDNDNGATTKPGDSRAA